MGDRARRVRRRSQKEQREDPRSHPDGVVRGVERRERVAARPHFARIVTCWFTPPLRSTVSGLVVSFSEPGLGRPVMTYLPGGKSLKDILPSASMFPEPPCVPTLEPPSGSTFTM